MREILFRGKRIDTGEWVEGYYAILPTDEGEPEHVIIETFDDGGVLYHFPPVDPSTVGQYTGLTDRNGTRIFECDVVAWTRDDIRIIGNYAYDFGTMYTKEAKFQVIVNEAGFMLARLEDDMLDTPNAWTKIDNYAFWNHHRDLEIIGNIHDNADLLK